MSQPECSVDGENQYGGCSLSDWETKKHIHELEIIKQLKETKS